MADSNTTPRARLTYDIRRLVCFVGDNQIFSINTFRSKRMDEAERLKHGHNLWAAIESQTSQATRDKQYRIIGGEKGQFLGLESIVSDVYVLPLLDDERVHGALTESTTARLEFHLRLSPKASRGKSKAAYVKAAAEYEGMIAKDQAIGACAFVPSCVSKVVLHGVKALQFWDSNNKSFLPGSPAAVPKIKDILASAAFRQDAGEEGVYRLRVLLALACAAKYAREKHVAMAFDGNKDKKALREDARKWVTKTTEKYRGRLHDAMILDFVFYIVRLEDEGHPAACIVPQPNQTRLTDEAAVDPDEEHEDVQCTEDREASLKQAKVDVYNRAEQDPSEPAGPVCIRARFQSIAGDGKQTAVVYLQDLKKMVRAFCTADPQAMLELTNMWLDDMSCGLQECCRELEYNEDRLGDLVAPRMEYKRKHHDSKKASQGCQADNTTPHALIKWSGRPGVPALHASDQSFIIAVWHEWCWTIAKPSELCDALDEEFEQLQCRNAKEAKRLGAGHVPDTSPVDVRDQDEVIESGDNERVARVHYVRINERIMRQYEEAGCMWLVPLNTHVAQGEEALNLEHTDSNAIGDSNVMTPLESEATFSDRTDPSSFARSIADGTSGRPTRLLPPDMLWQGPAAPPPPRTTPAVGYEPIQHPAHAFPSTYQQGMTLNGRDTCPPPQVLQQVEALLNSRDPAVMRLVEAIRTQLAGDQQHMPATNQLTPEPQKFPRSDHASTSRQAPVSVHVPQPLHGNGQLTASVAQTNSAGLIMGARQRTSVPTLSNGPNTSLHGAPVMNVFNGVLGNIPPTEKRDVNTACSPDKAGSAVQRLNPAQRKLAAKRTLLQTEEAYTTQPPTQPLQSAAFAAIQSLNKSMQNKNRRTSRLTQPGAQAQATTRSAPMKVLKISAQHPANVPKAVAKSTRRTNRN